MGMSVKIFLLVGGSTAIRDKQGFLCITFANTILCLRGGAARLARLAHNQKVAGSSPAPATNLG